jgi:uncharacterized integral membrane protein
MSDQVPQQQPSGGDEGPPWKLIALLVVVVALAIFFAQNGDDAPVEFLWLDANWPVWVVIGVSVLAGVALDRLVGWQLRRARRRKAELR